MVEPVPPEPVAGQSDLPSQVKKLPQPVRSTVSEDSRRSAHACVPYERSLRRGADAMMRLSENAAGGELPLAMVPLLQVCLVLVLKHRTHESVKGFAGCGSLGIRINPVAGGERLKKWRGGGRSLVGPCSVSRPYDRG